MCKGRESVAPLAEGLLPEFDSPSAVSGRVQCHDVNGQMVVGDRTPCTAPPPLGLPDHCNADRRCLRVNEAEVECASSCFVNGSTLWGILCDGELWAPGSTGGVRCDRTTGMPDSVVRRCNNSCSVTLYDGSQPIAPNHLPMVKAALDKRIKSREEFVFTVVGGTREDPKLEPGYPGGGNNRGWTWHQGVPSGLERPSIGPWVLVAVLQYSCGCGPSAVLDWFMEKGDGAGGFWWRLDPNPNDLQKYVIFMNEITVMGRDNNGSCYVALVDTPTVKEGKWMALGRVEWSAEGPLTCTDQSQFHRKNTAKGEGKKLPGPGRIKGLPPMKGSGRIHGGGDP